MERIRIHGTDLEVSQLCYGHAKLGLRPDEAEGGRLMMNLSRLPRLLK